MARPAERDRSRLGPPDTPTRATRSLEWAGAAVVVAAALAAGANTLMNGFVYDDHVNIVANPWIREPRALLLAFQNHVAAFDPNASTSFYRPMMHVIYAGAHLAFGLEPWGFHLVNVAFNAACSACVYLLLLRWTGSGTTDAPDGGIAAPPPWRHAGPLAGAVLFAVHPIHTEPVAWLAGITDLSYSLFLLLALLVATSAGASAARRLVVAPLLFFVAMLCKEPAVVLLPLLVLALAARGELSAPGPRRAAVATIAAHAVAVVAYLALRTWALGGLAGEDRRVEVGLAEGIATGVALLGAYLKLLALPAGLSAMHDFPIVTSLADPALWGGVAALAVLLGVGLRWFRTPGVLLGLGLLVLPLAPTLYLPAIGEGFLAERYLYLPSAGAALLVSVALGAAARSGRSRLVAAGALAAVTLVFGNASLQRNAVWRSDLSLWADTAPKVPGRAGAQEALGAALYFAGRHAEAVGPLSRAVELDPSLDDARVNLAASLCVVSRVDEALAQLGTVLARRPEHPEANAVLGWALTAQGRATEGISAYERAIAAKPALPTAHNALGIAYAQRGDLDRAARHFREAVRLDPRNPDYARNLAILGR